MLYGLMAYFDAPEKLLEAIGALKEAGYRRMEAFAPNPVEGVERLLGGDGRIPWVAFALGVLGAGLALFLQVYTTLDYPMNASGKPLLGWPAFIPVTFELTILTITVGIFTLSPLPKRPAPGRPPRRPSPQLRPGPSGPVRPFCLRLRLPV
jgi:Hypothetical conserved protein